MRKIYLLSFFVLCTQLINAQWSTDPTVNNLVCNASPTTTKSGQVVFIDANDNTFIAWVDARNATTGNDIYLQKLNASGNKIFADAGLLICDAINNQSSINIISDGSDGVIVSWLDNRNNTGSADIYNQRISGNGNILWAPNGIATINNTDNQIGNQSLKISSTEFIICWREIRNIPVASTTGVDIFANKYLLSDGSKVFSNDIEIVKQPNTQQQQQLISDNNNGFYCIWTDPRTATTSGDIYAQRINNDGSVATGWVTDGKEVCNQGATINLTNSQFVSDDAGGFIACWVDNRVASDINVYAQRIDGSTGNQLWDPNGVPVCIATGNQGTPLLIKDGSSGAIITWIDPRTTGATGNDIYAQKINSSGAVSWTANGVAICTATGNQPNAAASLSMITDKSGGAVICWDDARNGTANLEVYAQNISNSGTLKQMSPTTPLWATTNGVPVGTLTATNQRAPVMVSRNETGEAAIIVFLDSRSGTANASIYASSLNLLGLLPISYTSFTGNRNQNHIDLKWSLGSTSSSLDKFIIEKSNNGNTFSPIQTITATSTLQYTTIDANPFEGNNYYRVKGYTLTGEIKYTPIINVKFVRSKLLVSVNPNPIKEQFVLELQNATKGNYALQINSIDGKLLLTKSFVVNTGNYTNTVTLPNISNGNYQLTIVNMQQNKVIHSQTIVKQ